MKLSNTIERKYIECIETDEWEILSHDGWHNVEDSKLTIPYSVWRIEFDNGTILECADNHILITNDLEEIFAKDSLGVNIKTRDGQSCVISVIPPLSDVDKETMYDLEVDGDNTYYTNNVLSHNSITVASVILWHALFKKDYSVAILANKADQSQEIMDRIQNAYESLPKWIQQGAVTWNRRSFVLENGSKVFCSSTSSSAIRGKSVNMIYIDELAHIDHNLQIKFFNSVYPVITSGTTTKIIITSTPNGFELFAKLWMDAERGRNSYVPVRVNWRDVPGRDEKWKEETIRNTSEQQFRQEQECVCGETIVTLRDSTGIVYNLPIEEAYNLLRM